MSAGVYASIQKIEPCFKTLILENIAALANRCSPDLDEVLLPGSNGIIKQFVARSSPDAQTASIVSGGLLVEKTNKRRRNGAGEDVGWLAKHAMQALDQGIFLPRLVLLVRAAGFGVLKKRPGQASQRRSGTHSVQPWTSILP